MNQPRKPSTTSFNDPPQSYEVEEEPIGNHPTEIAAREGFGPLTELAETVWHGQSIPCVTCGQLVRRGVEVCTHCGQDLSPEMLKKMRTHAGPWYVLEHLRPFPGISIDRIIRQIRRGLITETSIIRGPYTEYQWRFAVETPGICRFFNRCWSCYATVDQTDEHCRRCKIYLFSDEPDPHVNASVSPANNAPAGTAPAEMLDDLFMLKDALNKNPTSNNVLQRQNSNSSGVHMGWIAAIVSVVVIVGLILITQIRAQRTGKPNGQTSANVISDTE